MEATTAGQAAQGAGGSEGAAGVLPGQEAEGQEPGAEATPEALQAWQTSVDGRLDGAIGEIRQMANLMQERIPEPQQEAQPSFEDQFNQLIENAPGGVIDPSQLAGLIQDSNQRAVQEALAPFQAQMQQFQQQMTAQELAGLQTSFPELADQKAADGLAEAMVNEIVGLRVPEQIAEGLLYNSAFARLVHLAGKAESAARGETPAGQGQQAVPQIETGGGAAPASGGGDQWDEFIKGAGGQQGPPIW